ncbi:MAG: DNA-processing protein DprA [Pirellulales bacterium]|nr:DNA-processing protein DprA [Pirellulales bacterium]
MTSLFSSAESKQLPTSAELRLAEVRLCLVPGIGPKMRVTLLEHFSTAYQVFSAAPAELRKITGVGVKLLREVQQAPPPEAIQVQLDQWQSQGIGTCLPGDATYPQLLSQLDTPPGLLFTRGELLATDQLALAIVGTRHCTQYGKLMAERLAAGLSRAGYTIISGLARGIDAAAHQAALSAGGRTIAVLGSGVANIYPPEHAELAVEISRQGAVISESQPAALPMKGSFPQRNRIISGMALGVIVVEADTGSGALITARHAQEQGREIFAVPGRADSRVSRGCHRLIRDGAKLVETVDDVLEELGPLVARTPTISGTEIQHPAELQLSDPEKAVLATIGSEAISIDQVISASGLSAPQVLSTLSVLEMRRLVRRGSGQMVQRR